MGNQTSKELPTRLTGFLLSITTGIIADIFAVWLSPFFRQVPVTLTLLFISILLVGSICLWGYSFWNVAKTIGAAGKRGWLQFAILFVAFIPLNLLMITVLLLNVDIERFTESIAPPEYLKFPSDPSAVIEPHGIQTRLQDGSTEIIMNYENNSRRPYCKFNMPLNYKEIREITLHLANVRESNGSIKVESGSYTFGPRDPTDQNPNLPVGYVRLRNGQIPFFLIAPEGIQKSIELPNITFTFEDVQSMANLSIKVGLQKPRVFGDASGFLITQAVLVVITFFLVFIAFYKEKLKTSFTSRNPK